MTYLNFSVIVQSMNLNLLKEKLAELGAPGFRYSQIVDYYFQSLPATWQDFSILPSDLREKLANEVPFSLVELVDLNRTDEVVKFVFKLKTSGELIEAVLMNHSDGRHTLCLSCQSGCAMACTFCATGTMGMKKNLTEFEIIDQVREVSRILKESASANATANQGKNETITNVVYMGMGEPFANYAAVKKSIEMLHDPKILGIGWRRITVSTSGIVPKIEEFTKDFPQVNLAISLHAADDEKRTKLMPINKTFPLAKLMKACRAYVDFTKRKLFFEYLVIDGFNDTDEDVENIYNLLNHPLFHLNLIRYHATEAVAEKYGVDFKAPSRTSLDRFMKALEGHGISLTLRRSFGEGIDAACGMLALKQAKTDNPRA